MQSLCTILCQSLFTLMCACFPFFYAEFMHTLMHAFPSSVHSLCTLHSIQLYTGLLVSVPDQHNSGLFVLPFHEFEALLITD